MGVTLLRHFASPPLSPPSGTTDRRLLACCFAFPEPTNGHRSQARIQGLSISGWGAGTQLLPSSPATGAHRLELESGRAGTPTQACWSSGGMPVLDLASSGISWQVSGYDGPQTKACFTVDGIRVRKPLSEGLSSPPRSQASVIVAQGVSCVQCWF